MNNKYVRRFMDMVRLGYEQIMDPFYLGFAAQIAFYFLLSIVPAIIVISQFLGLFGLSLQSVSDEIFSYIDPEGFIQNIMPNILGHSSSGTLNVFYSFIALWAASRATFFISRIANYTVTGGKTIGNYFTERIRSIKTVLITLFTLVFSLLILVYGNVMLNFAIDIIEPIISPIFGAATGLRRFITVVWPLLRWPLGFALYFLMISSNYYFLPAFRVPFKKIIPGSIFASFGMLFATMGYMYAQSHFMHYDLLYGSLSSVAALLMWFYILAWVLELGVLFNKVWWDTEVNP